MSNKAYNQPKKSASVHDREYQVIKASKRNFQGIIGQGRELKFDKNGQFTTNDPKIAKEINQRYGYEGGSKDVVVIEKDSTRSRAQKNVWGVPDLPWKRDKE